MLPILSIPDSLPALLLLEENPPPPQAPPVWPLMLGIFVLFWFLMIRPQMKEQKKRREMLASLKKNDRVVTSGGLIGVIVDLDDRIVTLKIDDKVRAKFQRSAVVGRLEDVKGGDGR